MKGKAKAVDEDKMTKEDEEEEVKPTQPTPPHLLEKTDSICNHCLQHDRECLWPMKSHKLTARRSKTCEPCRAGKVGCSGPKVVPKGARKKGPQSSDEDHVMGDAEADASEESEESEEEGISKERDSHQTGSDNDGGEGGSGEDDHPESK